MDGEADERADFSPGREGEEGILEENPATSSARLPGHCTADSETRRQEEHGYCQKQCKKQKCSCFEKQLGALELQQKNNQWQREGYEVAVSRDRAIALQPGQQEGNSISNKTKQKTENKTRPGALVHSCNPNRLNGFWALLMAPSQISARGTTGHLGDEKESSENTLTPSRYRQTSSTCPSGYYAKPLWIREAPKPRVS
ncbi:hypothetical protein AAY473_025003 [Plecturocebus cupreus]